ncbi:hypothetical protein [Georgenia thermotolerans]|uniref:DNA modification methylase n=1 Tax=Georgenia thermotolerans TaxID=527326 RepID=A0A7J5UJI8_9MICO|nr:hypothetical protein [Georgenia thermotolerans]KAE8762565.1 hypothetical protein GB883_18725 [Georgenia thermotolerans]
MARTIRRTAIAATTLGVALVLGGCTATNPITTQYSYAPSDGVLVQVGDGVSVENLMVLTEGEGQPGHVLGAVVNRSTEDVRVSLQIGDGGATVPLRVPAKGTVNFTNDKITTPSVGIAPGGVLPATVSADNAGNVSVDIPVLDGTIPPYDEYLRQNQA